NLPALTMIMFWYDILDRKSQRTYAKGVSLPIRQVSLQSDVMEQTMEQVSDDAALLTEMMDDLRANDALFQPTNYWTYYQSRFLPELRKYGLENFRRRKNSVLNAFAAGDRLYRPRVKLRKMFRGSERISRIIDRIMFSRNPFL